MNHRRDSTHSFDSDSLDNRRSDRWKRLGFSVPEEERANMFFEASAPPWQDVQSRIHRNNHYDDPEFRSRSMFAEPGSSSPSFGHRMRMGSKWAGEEEPGIPIRVVHDQTPPKGSGDEGTDSETSSQASHGSRGSSGGQPMKAKITREPRVHHIPIMVEPRDGSTSSGYASDGGVNATNKTATVPDPICAPPDPRKRSYPNENTSEPTFSQDEDYQAPNVQHLRRNFEQSMGNEQQTEAVDHHCQSVHTIPIKLSDQSDEKNSQLPPVIKTHQPPARSFSANSFSTSNPAAPPRQRKASSHPPTSTGPHITKVPINNPIQKEESPPPEEVKKSKPDPFHQIAKVLEDKNEFKKEVEQFEGGSSQDKQYRYLDEMLTRCILKLDNVETEGREDIRQARKAAVREIQDAINILESKLSKQVKEEVMEDEKTEFLPTQCMQEQMQVDLESQESKIEHIEDREMQSADREGAPQNQECEMESQSFTDK